MNNLTIAYAKLRNVDEIMAHNALMQLQHDCYDPAEFLLDNGLDENLLNDAIAYCIGAVLFDFGV